MAIPKKGTKRPAASSVGAQAKKAKSSTAGHCNVVAKALAGNPMLASVVKQTLGVYTDERHDVQAKFVVMIGEALATLEASLEQVESSAQAAVDGAGAEKATREKAMADAETELKAKEEALSAAEATLTTDTEAVQGAAATLKDAKSAIKALDAKVADGTKTQEEVANAQAKFVQMKEAPGAAADAKAVSKVVDQCSGDAQTLVYVPETLKKDPGSRSQFDAIIMQTVEDTLAAKLAELTQFLATAADEKNEKNASLNAAEAAQTSAEEKMAASKSAKEEASTALKAARTSLRDAKAAVASYESDMKSAEKELSLATKKKQSFAEGARASFDTLKDKVTPPPEPEQPEEPAAPAAPEEPSQPASGGGVDVV